MPGACRSPPFARLAKEAFSATRAILLKVPIPAVRPEPAEGLACVRKANHPVRDSVFSIFPVPFFSFQLPKGIR
jgi:hypothetical protein